MRTIMLLTCAITALSIISCQKKQDIKTPDNAGAIVKQNTISGSINPAFIKFSSLANGGQKMRRWIPVRRDCIDQEYTCFPDVIIIAKSRLELFNRAITGGGKDVSSFFSDDEVALNYFPAWNKDWFADVKTAILSGEYTFLPTSNGHYLMGKESELNAENYDLVFSYDPR